MVVINLCQAMDTLLHRAVDRGLIRMQATLRLQEMDTHRLQATGILRILATDILLHLRAVIIITTTDNHIRNTVKHITQGTTATTFM